jgi:hypothetical protein
MQYFGTCLMRASRGGHMEVVKYLYDLGGKELLMMRNNVSACVHVRCFGSACFSTRKRGKMHCCQCLMPDCTYACSQFFIVCTHALATLLSAHADVHSITFSSCISAGVPAHKTSHHHCYHDPLTRKCAFSGFSTFV